ncbi:RHS repeat domain-containing protein [Streptomyces sp. NPDC058678]|uniref:RHS repeat domain-containing protein n=1 Tax=Streptomyces sp. NPDC058678 TaxID=3346595 RepID=UPI003665DE1F
MRRLPVTVVDANSKRTDTTYDALGRKLRIWLPDRSKANGQTPTYAFSYTITDGKPSAVGTTSLARTGTQTSYVLYDGFLRARQAQAPGPQGGMLVSDTFYDARGLEAKTFASYYATTAPSTVLFSPDNALSVETQTWNTYDGLGRITQSRQVAGNGDGGQVLATTTTAYGGDRMTVTPPQGGTPTTTIVDARGNTRELDQYAASTPTGAYDKTLYDYTPAGKLAKITDPALTTWTYGYDQRGNQTTAVDPDKGTTTSHYDDRNLLVSSTDQRGKSITHVYDGLGRETETHDGDVGGPLLTKHVWDPTGFKGRLATATRYVGGATGAAYTVTYSLYDNLYRAHRTTTTIPAAEGALAGSYQGNVQYNADGTTQSVGYPVAGSLAAEAVTPTYDEVLRPVTVSGSGGATYTTGTTYSYTGDALQYTFQAAGKPMTQVTNTYEWGTRRLSNSRVDRQDVPGTDKSATYAYDPAGDITSITDVSRDGTDAQCFQYDYLGRLTQAWAQGSTGCAGAPSASALGGPASYWQSFGYDKAGDRTSETDHSATEDTTQDKVRTYTYPAPTSPQPHTLSQVQTTGPSGTTLNSYTYDAIGDTATRTVGGTKQTLEWDGEGHLAKVTGDDGKTTSYVYDADGNRLIGRTDSGTTLYLGGTEVTLAAGSTTPHATRYYDLGDGNQAVRTDDNTVSFVLADSQGTGQLQVNSADLTMQQRRTTPFGDPRGAQPANWSGDKGFVGGINDPGTGLTHLGARDYDPTTGRFTSVDPELDSSDPQSLNGYAYAGNSPVTQSDPTGLYTCRNGHEGCNEHGNACGSDCSAWATQSGDCVHTECSNSKVNQNPQVSLKTQRQVSYERRHCDDVCGTLGITTPRDPEWQDLLKDLYGGNPSQPDHDTYAAEHAQEKSVAFTPHPSYAYETSEYIGPNSLGTPEEIMAFFKAHPQEIFPFKVTGCDSFTQGAKCTLYPGDSMMHGLGKNRRRAGAGDGVRQGQDLLHLHRDGQGILRRPGIADQVLDLVAEQRRVSDAEGPHHGVGLPRLARRQARNRQADLAAAGPQPDERP